MKVALAISNLNPRQKEVILSWCKDNMSEDVVVEACYFVMLTIGRPSFNYITMVIKTWKENNIKTIEEAKRFVDKSQKYNSKFRRISVKRKFANFKQRRWDSDKLRRIACNVED